MYVHDIKKRYGIRRQTVFQSAHWVCQDPANMVFMSSRERSGTEQSASSHSPKNADDQYSLFYKSIEPGKAVQKKVMSACRQEPVSEAAYRAKARKRDGAIAESSCPAEYRQTENFRKQMESLLFRCRMKFYGYVAKAT